MFQISIQEHGGIQIKSIREGGVGTIIQPPLAGGHCLAEPVPMDDALSSHYGRAERLGIQQIPPQLPETGGGGNCEVFGRAVEIVSRAKSCTTFRKSC